MSEGTRSPQPAAMQLGAWLGQRDADVDPEFVDAVVRRHDGEERDVLKSDERSIVTAVRTPESSAVVKEVLKGGFRRRVADVFRGTPARRAFETGRRLRELGIGAARPLAFLEQRAWGLPSRSLLVCEDLRGSPTADQVLASESPTLDGLTQLAIALHGHGVIHGDLRAQHVHLVDGAGPTLIDLEGARIRSSPTDAQRIEDLAQLNASIADHLVSPEERRQAFSRYARALPFRASEEEVARRITARSLARAHLYRGSGCALATGER